MDTPASADPRARCRQTVLTLALLLLTFSLMSREARAGTASDTLVYLPLAVRHAPFDTTALGAGFDQVTAITHAGDERLFIVERVGRVKILYPDGGVTVFLDISDHVLSEPGEYGTYDLAFHPGYADPASPGYGFFYISYTGRHQGAVRTFIARFRVSADPDVADASSETWLSRIEQSFSWHKGGELDFDPAGDYLYAGLGDDRQGLLAQNIASPKGKIVRLRVDDAPPDVTGDATGYLDEEVWALGLRNPWRFDVDPPSGQIYIGDVGEKEWEEINLLALAGRYANFGWPCLEGPDVDPTYAGYAACANTSGFVLPVASYQHEGVRCAVIGGKVYRPAGSPGDGRFIFADLCLRDVYALQKVGADWQTTRLGALDAPGWLTTIGEDAQGNLYAGTAATSGPIYRLFIEPLAARQ